MSVDLVSHSYVPIKSAPYYVEWWGDEGPGRSPEMSFDAAVRTCAEVEGWPATYGVALCVNTAIGRRPDYTATPQWASHIPAGVSFP